MNTFSKPNEQLFPNRCPLKFRDSFLSNARRHQGSSEVMMHMIIRFNDIGFNAHKNLIWTNEKTMLIFIVYLHTISESETYSIMLGEIIAILRHVDLIIMCLRVTG